MMLRHTRPALRRAWVLAVGAIVLLLLVAGIADAKKRRRARKPKPAPAAAPAPLQEPLHGGVHWREPTDSGPLHIFRPDGYDPTTASTVVYVHGYYTKVDRAVEEHKLLAQFAGTKTNALFIIPEAPSGLRDSIKWWSLGELIRKTKTVTGLARPWGPLVVIGHSGAYRTVTTWLDYGPVDVVILVDAMYGEESAYTDWLDRTPRGRLINIGADTFRWTEDFVRTIAPEVVLDRIPETPIDVPSEAITARHVYLRSHLGHMELVMQGGALPTLLRIANVAPLALQSPP